jgi:general secretion pathway protein G
MMARKGFTLVEILIVVIILGILAAIVIPQFTDASTQARESSLKSDLQTVRSQIGLYEVQHNDSLPGTGAADFVTTMTGKTDVTGAVSTDPNAFGPYLQQMPTNPFNNMNTVGTNGTAGSSTYGWMFNTTSGVFQADDSATHATW